MSGNRPKRGLADFLSRELKGPPAPAEPEVRHSETSEVRTRHAPREAHENKPPVEKAPVVAHAPVATKEPVTAKQPVTTKAPKAPVVAHAPVAAESPKTPAEHHAPAVAEVEAPKTPVVREAPAVAVSSVVEAPVAVEAPEVREEPAAVMRAAEIHTAHATDHSEPKSAKAPKSRTAEVRESVAAEKLEPLYLRLTRKDVRFRDEQLTALHLLARRLSKARRGTRGERITDNTLVRVAVDLLLQHGDELAGTDEASLLESLRKLSRKRA